MSRLILHIGAHKTGTTSIQRFLHANRAALAARGIYYPGYDLIGVAQSYAHHGVAHGFAGGTTPFSREETVSFFAEMHRRMVDYDLTILSAEPFYRHFVAPSKGEVPEAPEDYWPARHAYIDRVAEIAGPAEVVVVFRGQDDFAQSVYQETVKAGRQTLTFDAFLTRRWFHFAFLQQVEAWERAFPGVSALSFERLAREGDLVEAFCRSIGIDPAGLEPQPRSNEGLLVDLVLLKRAMNGTPIPRNQLRGRIEALAAQIDGRPKLLERLKARSFFESPKARAAFRDGFAEDNAVLGARFMRNVPDGEEVFPARPEPDGIRYGGTLDGWAADALVRMALNGIDGKR
jgi:hypothetical protein